MNITTTLAWNVDDAVLNTIACDLITTAVEGGINSWAVCKTYRWGDETLGHSHNQANGSKAWQPGEVQYATVTISDAEAVPGDEPDFEPITVDAAKMIAAITLLMTSDAEFYTLGYSQTFKSRLRAAFDELKQGVPWERVDFDYDAGDADCMMQLACFGKVIYG